MGHVVPNDAVISDRVDRRLMPSVLVWAFGLAPLFLILVSWNNHEQTWLLKAYALPVAVVELLTVAAAFLSGMRIRPNRMTLCLLVLLLLAWAMAFLAPEPRQAIFMTEMWTLHALFGFAAARLFEPRDLTIALVSGFVASAAALAVFALTAPADFHWIGEMPGLGNPRSFALYAAVAIGLSIGLMAGGRISAAAIVTIAFVMIFWSGSRGAVFATLVAMAVSLLLFPVARKPAVWLSFVASALFGAGIAYLLGSPDQLVGVTRISEVGDTGRLHLWRLTADLISERPWFGYGEGQTLYLVHIPWTMHPHNIVLQILLAWGIVGLALVGVLAWRAAREVFLRVEERTLPLVVAIGTLALYSLIDGAIYNVHTAAVFAACLGVVLGSRCAAPDSKARPAFYVPWLSRAE